MWHGFGTEICMLTNIMSIDIFGNVLLSIFTFLWFYCFMCDVTVNTGDDNLYIFSHLIPMTCSEEHSLVLCEHRIRSSKPSTDKFCRRCWWHCSQSESVAKVLVVSICEWNFTYISWLSTFLLFYSLPLYFDSTIGSLQKTLRYMLWTLQTLILDFSENELSSLDVDNNTLLTLLSR